MPLSLPDYTGTISRGTKSTDVSILYATHIDLFNEAFQGHGVVSGCTATENGSPNMTYNIATGKIVRNGILYEPSATTATISTADATNPRIDLISISTSGTITVTAGTASATPVLPSRPANNVALYGSYVAANDTAAASNANLIDMRVTVKPPIEHYIGHFRLTSAITTTSTSFVDVDGTNVKESITLSGGETVIARFMISRTWNSGWSDNTYRLVAGSTVGDDANEIVNSTQEKHPVWLVAKWTDLSSGTYDFKPQWKTTASTARIEVDTPITWKIEVHRK